MKSKVFIGVIIVVCVLVVIAVVKGLQFKAMGDAQKAAPLPVSTIASFTATNENWQDSFTAIGTVNAAQGVLVSPEIAGMVSEIDFDSGATVNKGDLLIRLDTASEEAQLRAAQAQVDLARLTAERNRKLILDKTVSQSDFDSAESLLKQSQANADAISAVIDKKTIRAPFSGHLGIRLVNLGQQLDVGKSIVSLQALTPVYVDFSLPQQDLSKLATGLKVNVTSDAYPGTNFTGELIAINPDLDINTRSVQLRAVFGNADQLLRPGMFVRAEVVLPVSQPVLVIPATAVLSAPYGDAVYLIMTAADAGLTNLPPTQLVAQQKFIRTGLSRGDFTIVESGLKPGDQVVSAGLFKLHNGDPISVNNTNAPTPVLSPRLPNS
jgi:membrane fusion protein (multidrug efflux system)